MRHLILPKCSMAGRFAPILLRRSLKSSHPAGAGLVQPVGRVRLAEGQSESAERPTERSGVRRLSAAAPEITAAQDPEKGQSGTPIKGV